MDAIQSFVQKNKVLVVLIVGGVLGLLLGLLMGWVIWPVQWTNATPSHLRSDFQGDYLTWVADQYANTGDLEWARAKLGAEFWEEGALAEALDGLSQEHGGQTAIHLRALGQALEVAPLAPSVAEEPSPTSEAPGTGGGITVRSVATVCGVALLVVAFVGGVLYLVNRLRKREAGAEAAGTRVGMTAGFPAMEDVSWGAEGRPLAQFVTTYTLGDDHYDPSFSIEMENGEFMGECGVGVSETIGVGAPNKVTAFEIWLFDKNDIRTVTQVLMSDYAFHDDALRTKLAPKGEPVLAEADRDIVLETKTLRVRARVVELEYGAGNLPPDSFFAKLTMDLAAWVVPAGQESAAPVVDADAPVMPPTL